MDRRVQSRTSPTVQSAALAMSVHTSGTFDPPFVPNVAVADGPRTSATPADPTPGSAGAGRAHSEAGLGVKSTDDLVVRQSTSSPRQTNELIRPTRSVRTVSAAATDRPTGGVNVISYVAVLP